MFHSFVGTSLLASTAAGMGDVMNNGMSLGERLQYAAEMTAVGLLIVFSVLGIIYLAMLLFRLVFYTIPNRRKASAAEQETADGAVESTDLPPETQDDTLVAVITAAVAAVLADEAEAAGTSAPAFRVVSFRRTGKSWNSRA
ncbi:MAG: OadG family protein [Clostridia bacterium]|nr:OadG family protein [Clostridia bacterium]